MPRRSKLTAAPDVMTTPPLQLLALLVRTRRQLSFAALGRLLGCSEYDATRLCRGDEHVATLPIQGRVVAFAATVLGVQQSQLEQWCATPMVERRGMPVTDAIVAVFSRDNELTRLHRQVASSMTTSEFAAAVGVSRQRLWVLQQRGSGVGYNKAVAKARRIG